jgi:diguanylate cyclase (GGDEF)-like protein/PAS domain S-box-containing protein
MLNKGKILAVDDTPASLRLLKDILKSEGYEVLSAISGELALNAAKNNPPDLILLDIRMPGMDGYEVCRRFKADSATRDVPVIFLSAASDTDEKVRGFEVGAVDFVTKPYQSNELLARVRTHLELNRLRNHLESVVEERTVKLYESEEKFRKITESAQDAIIMMDADGCISTWNFAAERFFGYSIAEAIGRKLHPLIAPYDAELVFKRGFQHFLQTGTGPIIGKVSEFIAIRKSGETFPVEVSLASLQIGEQWHAIGIFRDITERKHAEENLLITASVFDNTQEAVLITDANNLIIDVNPAFTKITRYSREEVIGKNPKLLGSGCQDKSFYAAMWQSLIQDKAWRGEIWNRTKSGEIYPEMLSISVVCGNDGQVLRYVGVFSDLSNVKEHEAELDHAANYDALTGIPNRVLLTDRMKQAIAQTSRDRQMMAVCYLDLDCFKPINDTISHEMGDYVLIEIAKRIENTIRGGDTVARLGGDEFVILLLGLDKAEECVITLERLLAAIACPITFQDKSCTISASIGVTIYPLDNVDPDILLRHVDQAMYKAKQAGKNCFYIYDPELGQREHDRHEFVQNIRLGLENNQFKLLYQPKINLRTKELVGVEALIRWQHPDRGLLSPDKFLRHIDNTDLDIKIGEWVTATALAQMEYWRSTGLDIEVSINISGFHMESAGFVEALQLQLTRYPDMLPGKFQIEVLETVALNDIASVRNIIESCRKIGVGFALDDFGTGYSSLSYLSGLPVDSLKIDQSFVRDMLEDKGDMNIVQGIIALAQAFDRQTVAEGIETKEHYQVLLDMGCELGQGYFIGRPMPADKLMDWQTNFCL